MHFEHAEAPLLNSPEAIAIATLDDSEEQEQPFMREGRKIGRNDPCPCGSELKFKQCHGKLS